ncbi:MAG TPA: AAC(3) family N-acetyltransferase [Pyrinomonadaceae bacterium]|nr:AAC(3) family N-acetyltransferase [Pyrinomonadaceae bacterium]
MKLKELAKGVLRESGTRTISGVRRKVREARLRLRSPLNETEFSNILMNALGLGKGDTVFVHSSIDQLNLGFPFYRVLPLMEDLVGAEGTLLFPTYPRLSSYEFLIRGEVFNIKKSPSYTGILSEVARRQANAVRSLHPTKSVCAIGAAAEELTRDHQESPYPYDRCSPYYRITEFDGKIVGLGVSTRNLSFVHCVDDALKDDFPVRPYHEQLFAATCINGAGSKVIVETYAHDLRKMVHNIPRFMKTYVSSDACIDLNLNGMRFFRANARRLFDEMSSLAATGKTIYPPSVYSNKPRGAT